MEEDARVNFVSDHPQVVLRGESGDAFKRAIIENRAGGIVRRVKHQHASLRRNFRSDLGKVRLKLISLDQPEGNCFCAETTRE